MCEVGPAQVLARVFLLVVLVVVLLFAFFSLFIAVAVLPLLPPTIATYTREVTMACVSHHIAGLCTQRDGTLSTAAVG